MDIWKNNKDGLGGKYPAARARRLYVVSIVLALIGLLIVGRTADAGRTVRVGVYQNEPKVFIDEQGRPAGLFIELLEAIALEEDWTLVYTSCIWSDCLQALTTGQIDLMPDVAYSFERDAVYDFHSTPVVESWSQVYARSSFMPQSFPELAGRRVALLKDSIQETVLTQMMRGFGFGITLVPAESWNEAFQFVADGVVDAAVANRFFGDFYYRQYGLLKTPIVFNAVTLHYVTAQGYNADLLQAIDRHLETWRREPTSMYYTILSRWVERPPEYRMPTRLKWGIAAIGGGLLLSLVIIGLLRWQVAVKTRHLAQSNAMLQISEAKYRLLAEATRDVIILHDMQGRITYINQAGLDFSGFEATEVVGQPIMAFIPSEYLADVVARYTQRAAGDSTRYLYELEFVNRYGQRMPVEVSSTLISNVGEPPQILAIARDITARKQAEASLRESEARYRSMFENNHAVMLIIDPDGGAIVEANPAAAQFYGWTQEELRQKKIGEINTLSPSEVQAEMNLARAQQRHHFLFRHRLADGSIRDVEVFSGPISVHGRTLLYSIVHDITERKRAETLLKDNERRQRRYAELLAGLIGNGQFFGGTLDENLKNIVQLSAQVLETERTSIWVYNEDYSEIVCRCLYTLSTGTFSAGETLRADAFPSYTASHKVGSVIAAYDVWTDPRTCDIPAEYYAAYGICSLLDTPVWTRGRLAALLSFEHVGRHRHWLPEEEQLAQTLATYISFCFEADERVRAQESLRESEERLRRALASTEHLLAQIQAQARQMQDIMDTVPEGVLLLNVRGWILLTNPVAEQILQSLGMDVNQRFTHLGDRSLDELLTSPPQGLRHEATADNRFFEIIARPIAEGPTPEQWVLVIHEVTQERIARQQLERQERLVSLGQLAAGIAHDFNNILAGIVLYGQMSLRMSDLSPKLRERLTLIVEQAHRAADLVNQILDFGRRAVLDRRPLDLEALLREQIKLWERTLPETIRIVFTGEPGTYVINADQTRMQQMFMNLVLNARDAMPEGGVLHISLARVHRVDMEPAGDWVRVDIADTGTGIPDEVLAHIYEPFFTTKAPGKGAGLGLAQVYGIVVSHDGKIDVKTHIGEGTTFSIYFPLLYSSPVTPPESQADDLPLGHGETILVVEDNPVTRTAVVTALLALQYRALEATNGKEALAILAQRPTEVALVLSDLVMPEMGGKALAAALRQQTPPVRMVVMSGHPLGVEVENLRELGIVAWVQKPPDLQELATALAQALKSSQV